MDIEKLGYTKDPKIDFEKSVHQTKNVDSCSLYYSRSQERTPTIFQKYSKGITNKIYNKKLIFIIIVMTPQ